jgi:acetamidase/formamidase
MTTHTIEPDARTTHGGFDRDREPVLSIDPGDTVVLRTLDASWGHVGNWLFDLPIPDFSPPLEQGPGHALCGPIYVRGAEPGDVLEIEIGAIRPGPWGHTFGGANPALRAEPEVRIGWRIDAARGTATDINGLGITITLRPFMGVMGNAPGAPGRHSSTPPRRVGGNLDCRELVAGSTLRLPVEVDGALFSVGDGHAVQGDGEVSYTAIECPMEGVELSFHLRKDVPIAAPEAITPAGYLTMGIGATLDIATTMAVNAMLDHMERTYRLGRSEALALASLVVNLRVTQIVNQTVGVHAVLPPDAFERA